jgi:hypothetical protein
MDVPVLMPGRSLWSIASLPRRHICLLHNASPGVESVFGRDWEGGTAVIVARRNTVHQVASAPIYEYVADITPDSRGAAFRATIESPTIIDHSKFQPPDVGDSVRVKINPKSMKVKFDKSDLTLDATSAARAARAEFESLVDLPPGAASARDMRRGTRRGTGV